MAKAPTQGERIAALEDQVSALMLKVKVLESPISQPTSAPATAAIRRNRPTQDGLVHPTCLNFRKCGNKSEGVSIQEAIGWKCPSCSGSN